MDLLSELEDDVPEVFTDGGSNGNHQGSQRQRPQRGQPLAIPAAAAPAALADLDAGVAAGRIRFGWCCMWSHGEGNCKTTTATFVGKLSRSAGLQKVNDLIMHNHRSLLKSLEFCAANGIGSFRITSRLLPLYTHPKLGYRIEELPDAEAIKRGFTECGEFARKHGIRTLFHPDQFCVGCGEAPVDFASLPFLTVFAIFLLWSDAGSQFTQGGCR